MAGKGKKGAFGAIPARLFEDSSLSGLDMRVMGVVAARDWMSDLRENGAGCFLSFRQIAVIADAHVSSITKSITKLVDAGYLRTKPFAADRRRKSLVVIYDQERDQAVMQKAKVVGGSANDFQPETSENVGGSANEMPKDVGGSANETPEIVGEANSQAHEITEESALQDTPLRGERYEVKPRKIFPERARPQNAIARAVEKLRSAGVDNYEEITAALSMVERELKRDPTQLTDSIADILEHITNESLDTRLTSHAQRILESYDVYESEENGFPDERQDEPARADASELPDRQVDAPDTALMRAEVALIGYCEAGFPVGLIGKHLALIEREMARDPRPASAALIESLKRIVIHVADKAVQQHAGRLLGDYGHHAELNAADPEGLCPF